MKNLLSTIRLLVFTCHIIYTSCQDGFNGHDFLRLQQLSSNNGQTETNNGYSTNVMHQEQSKNSANPVSVQYNLKDNAEDLEKLVDFHRTSHGRSDSRRKIFHIKNPFQRQLDDNSREQRDHFRNEDSDSDTGASNQYAAMQYSLPPEEFLQQLRAENQYLQQYSTPAPAVGYTATPQPPYQFPTNTPETYEVNQPTQNQLLQLDSNLQQNSGNLQYVVPSGHYSSDNGQNNGQITSYVSTAIPSNQFVGTPSNVGYVSSAAPNFLSSPPDSAQFVSSPSSAFQSENDGYGNRITNSINNYGYGNNEVNKNMQIDHFNNAANGIRYPFDNQQRNQNEFSSTPASPSSTLFNDQVRESWQNTQNTMNVALNSLSKSVQEAAQLSQYQNQLQENQHESRADLNNENMNSETHRVGNNMAAANNLYMNFVQPDYQLYHNIKSRTRDLEQEIGQPDFYSHGDYGWKLNNKRPLINTDNFGSSGYSQQKSLFSSQSENAPISHVSFQSDVYNQQNKNTDSNVPSTMQHSVMNQGVKSSLMDSIETQDFVKAATKAHESMKQQQAQQSNEHYYGHSYSSPFGSGVSLGSNLQSQPNVVTTYYGNTDKQGRQSKTVSESSNSNLFSYGGSQNDMITVSPYYYANSKENSYENKIKQPFDHAKALKNIVPIDVSNVVQNSENSVKSNVDNSNRYNVPNFSKDQVEQSFKQIYGNYKSLADAYYKDKNTGYGFNIKTKPDEIVSSSDGVRQADQNLLYYSKSQNQEPNYNQGMSSDTKRYADGTPERINYIPQASNSYSDHIQLPINIQRQQTQQDLSSILKLNDIPYKFPQQSLIGDPLRFGSNFDQALIPQTIPGRINQNVGNHQLDVTGSLLSKLNMLNNHRQFGIAYNRPSEIDPQTGGLYSTINGIRVANPFNVDLKLVSDMLKGKPSVDETHMAAIREQFAKPQPIKLDMSSLQQLLSKHENYGNYKPYDLLSLAAKFRVNEAEMASLGNHYLDVYNGPRHPYQGVKYSRSQEEEEESILPIADSSNTHPIGAVMEQDDSPNTREGNGESDITAQNVKGSSYKNSLPKPVDLFDGREHRLSNGPRHPNFLMPGRYNYHRKYPKHDVNEPYPLLKPPSPHQARSRITKSEKMSRLRRLTRHKLPRIFKTEALFESENSGLEGVNESSVPILLKPPRPAVSEKSDEQKTA